MGRYLPLIFKNSLRNLRRTVLTVASIAVSFCLLGFLLAVYRVMFIGADSTPSQALRLFTHNCVSLAQPLPVSYEQKIEKVPGVTAVSVWQWFGGVYKDARDPKNFFMRMAAEPSKVFRIWPELQMPEDQKLAFERERSGCIAAKALADKFGWKLGERITLAGDIFPVTLDLTLVGIFDNPTHDEMLLFNNAYLRESISPNDPSRDAVGAFLVQAERPEEVARVSRAIDAIFENSPAQTKSETERAFQLSFVSFLGNLKLFLMAICGAVTFTILLVSGNTLSMSVRERIREIGILKTLGFTPGAILGLTLGEAGLLAVSGGMLGCGLAVVLCDGLRGAPAGIQMLRVLSLTPALAAITLFSALLLGVISALLPAFSASRTSILDSIRYTG